MASVSQSSDMQESINTIRALVLSQKGMTAERDLLRDYHKLNGERIPFKKFGFSNLEDFLRKSGEFTIKRNDMGELIVSAKAANSSSHIVALINKQKSSSSGGRRKRMSASRAPRSNDQSWTKTSYSSAFSKLPSSEKTMKNLVQRNRGKTECDYYDRKSNYGSSNNNSYSTKNRNYLDGKINENYENLTAITTKNLKNQDIRQQSGKTSRQNSVDSSHNISRQNSMENKPQQNVTDNNRNENMKDNYKPQNGVDTQTITTNIKNQDIRQQNGKDSRPNSVDSSRNISRQNSMENKPQQCVTDNNTNGNIKDNYDNDNITKKETTSSATFNVNNKITNKLRVLFPDDSLSTLNFDNDRTKNNLHNRLNIVDTDSLSNPSNNMPICTQFKVSFDNDRTKNNLHNRLNIVDTDSLSNQSNNMPICTQFKVNFDNDRTKSNLHNRLHLDTDSPSNLSYNMPNPSTEFKVNFDHDRTKNSLQNRLQLRFDVGKPSILPPIEKSTPSPTTLLPLIKEVSTKKVKMPTTIEVTIPSQQHNVPISRNSLQDRLRIIKQVPHVEPQAKSPVLDNVAVKTPSPIPSIVSSIPLPINMTPPEELAHFCETRNYTKPDYKFVQLKSSIKLQCKVTVNEVAYSTYPEEFLTEYEAQSAAARIALDNLKEEEMRSLYPICVESDFNVAIKIFNKLKEYPNGVFSERFPELFQQTYEQSLPENWFSIVVSSSQLFSVEETASDTFILYGNVRDSSSSSVSTISDSDSTNNDKINLPWHKEHWDLYITNPVSTIQIWARIIGDDFSDKMDALITDIEMAMLTDKARAQTLQIGNIYLVSVVECWCRVRVNELDFEQNRCLCFFIDTGDEEWYSMEHLFICDPRFMKLPAQALLFSLFGLEDFDENPNAKRELEILSGRTVIAQIFTKAEEYIMEEESANFEARIKVVLYDTSSEEDVNLNPLILQRICENTPKPKFERNAVTDIIITHISKIGDIFCQIKNSGTYYIEKLINNLIESKLNEDLHCGLYQDKSIINQYYLVYDQQDKKWYRAVIELFSKVENEYKFFYIDYGITRILKTTRLLRTDSLSAALHRFPPQAVKVRLHSIENITDNVVARLRGLLKPGSPAMVKVYSFAAVPHVNIYIRLTHNFALLCVNETIRLEQEIEESSEINQNVINLTQNLSSTVLPPYRSPSQLLNTSSSSSSSKISVSAKSYNSSSSISELDAQFQSFEIKSKSPVNSTSVFDLPKLKLYVHPGLNQIFNVRVSMASNPTYFVIQPNDDAPQLHELMRELQTYCLNNREFIPSDCVKVGEVYAALHSDGNWYRATVENIYKQTMIHVCYCDFGDVTVLTSDKLKILPINFRTLPKQAIKAKLYGIKPTYRDWAMDDCLYFQELVVGKVFVSVIKAIKTDELCKEDLIEIILNDVSGDTDILIHELLINESRAVFE